MKIKKGDNIVIISGKDKGFKGEVIQVNKKGDRITVDDANLIKRHIRSPKKGEKGQRIEMPAPIHVSNVKLFCSNCKAGVRVGFKVKKAGKKIDKKDGAGAGAKDSSKPKQSKKRICKKCNNEI